MLLEDFIKTLWGLITIYKIVVFKFKFWGESMK